MLSSERQQQVQRAGHNRGVTLVELMLSLGITGMVFTALAMFTTAVASGWKQNSKHFADATVSKRVSAKLEAAVVPSLWVLAARNDLDDGSSIVFLWRNDSVGAADLKVQLGELALVEFDANNKTLWIYEVNTLTASSDPNATLPVGTSDLNQDDLVNFFKSQNFVLERRPLAGGSTQGQAWQVNDAQFSAFAPQGGKPICVYTLSMSESESALKETSGSIVLRTPQQPLE